MSKVEIVNLYKTMPSKYKNKQWHYDNEKLMNIKMPARILITGTTGSGKTNLVMNLIRLINNFDRIFLFAKNRTEPLYEMLKDTCNDVEEKSDKKIFFYSDNIDEIPEAKDDCFKPFPEDSEPTKDDGSEPTKPKKKKKKLVKNLVIIDDFVDDKSLKKSNASTLFTQGRKKGITVFFLSQSYYLTPKLIRDNINYCIFTKVMSSKDMSRIMNEYNLDIDKNYLNHLVAKCTGKIDKFFMIDLETNDPNMRYRCNFEGIKMSIHESDDE